MLFIGLDGVAQHAGGQVDADHVRALRGDPAGAGRGTATDLDDPPPPQRAEQARVGLAQALRAPAQVDLAEEVTVFVLVTIGVGVPPAAVRAAGLRVGDGTAGDPRFGHVHTVRGFPPVTGEGWTLWYCAR